MHDFQMERNPVCMIPEATRDSRFPITRMARESVSPDPADLRIRDLETRLEELQAIYEESQVHHTLVHKEDLKQVELLKAMLDDCQKEMTFLKELCLTQQVHIHSRLI